MGVKRRGVFPDLRRGVSVHSPDGFCSGAGPGVRDFRVWVRSAAFGPRWICRPPAMRVRGRLPFTPDSRLGEFPRR